MSNAARLPIVAPRVGACVRTILFRGVDLTGVTFELQARLNPDTPGAPLIDLTMQAAGTEGISLGAVVVDTSGIPSTPVVIRIAESTMKDAAKVPYMGELGDPGVLAYSLVAWGGSIGADKRVIAYGDFIAQASAFGSDNAPAGRLPSFQRMEAWAGANTATIQWDAGTTVQVSIDGVDVLAVLLAQARAAMTAAEQAADRAETITSAFQAASQRVRTVDQRLLSVADDAGNEAISIRAPTSIDQDGSFETPMFALRKVSGWLWAYTDAFRNVLFGVNDDGDFISNSSSVAPATYDLSGLYDFEINQVFEYGQS